MDCFYCFDYVLLLIVSYFLFHFINYQFINNFYKLITKRTTVKSKKETRSYDLTESIFKAQCFEALDSLYYWVYVGGLEKCHKLLLILISCHYQLWSLKT